MAYPQPMAQQLGTSHIILKDEIHVWTGMVFPSFPKNKLKLVRPGYLVKFLDPPKTGTLEASRTDSDRHSGEKLP
jgi:hypothetical protein